MEIINITCLRQKSQRHRPKWVGKLPERLAEKWQLKYCPWVETAEGCWCLQTDRDGCFLPPWREKARELLEQAAKQGAKIALSPICLLYTSLDGVFVCTNSTVGAQTPEFACDCACVCYFGFCANFDGCHGNVINDTNGEVVSYRFTCTVLSP